MLTLLKSVWAGLIPLGLLFIALELRCGFDRCFRYFGIAQLLLCAMTGIDLWILPDAHPLAVELFWTRAMFVVGCQFALFYFWYMAELTHWESRRFIQGLSAYAILLSALFFTDYLLRPVGGIIARAIGFDLLFQPFMALCLFGALTLILNGMRRAQKGERRILALHLAGFLMLFLFGCLDVVFTYYIPEPFFVSFNTFGSLAFGISTSCILLERIMALLREREALAAQIRSAFEDVAESRSLRIVGESAAMVHHEVKNYVSLIKGNLQLISAGDGSNLDPHRYLERIKHSAEGLESITRGILDLPAAFRIAQAGKICLVALLEDLIRKGFPSAPIRFSPDSGAGDMWIHGDAAKLEQAFFNLIKNACEVGAGHIAVRCIQKPYALVISVEDDGPGCDAGRLQSLGKPFYTTKKDAGGTGIGICVSKAIIENHGGSLSFYSKNGIPAFGTGLIANAVLPRRIAESEGIPESRGIFILSQHAEMGMRLAGVARNIFLAPVVSAFQAQGTKQRSSWNLALIGEGTDARTDSPIPELHTKLIRVRPDGYARFQSEEEDTLDAGIFCEMFLAKCMDAA